MAQVASARGCGARRWPGRESGAGVTARGVVSGSIQASPRSQAFRSNGQNEEIRTLSFRDPYPPMYSLACGGVNMGVRYQVWTVHEFDSLEESVIKDPEERWRLTAAFVRSVESPRRLLRPARTATPSLRVAQAEVHFEALGLEGDSQRHAPRRRASARCHTSPSPRPGRKPTSIARSRGRGATRSRSNGSRRCPPLPRPWRP